MTKGPEITKASGSSEYSCIDQASHNIDSETQMWSNHEEGEELEPEQRVFQDDNQLELYLFAGNNLGELRKSFQAAMEDELEKPSIDQNSSTSGGSVSYYEVEWKSLRDYDSDDNEPLRFKGTETKGALALSSMIETIAEPEDHDLEPEPTDFDTSDPLKEELGFGEVTLRDAQKQELSDREVKEALLKQFEEISEQKIISNNELEELKELIMSKIEAFGISQEVCKLSQLTPLQVRLKADAQPFTAEPRSMSGEKREALRQKLADLKQMGMIEHEPNPFFSSPAFMVPKPSKDGQKRWRMVIDMRKLNEQVEVNGNSLPNLESQLSWIDPESKYFASMDALSGFDLLPVHPAHSTFFCINTVFGCFKLLGAPMGFINTPSVYQDRLVTEILNGIEEDSLFGHGCLQWLDDTLMYASTWKEFLSIYKRFLDRCISKGVRLNVLKCKLLESETTWCGRRITPEGWSFSKKYFKKILEIPQPKRLGELEDIIYGVNWLSSSIPELAELKAPFQDLMLRIKNSALNIRGTRLGRKQRANLLLENWTQEMTEAFKKFRNRIVSAAEATLANYNGKEDLVLVTDASHLFWSAMLCMANNVDECLREVPAGSHEFGELTRLNVRPVYFLSGKFKSAEINWTTPEKELFPILAALKRFDFLTTAHARPILVLTDHLNLVYLFRPPSSVRGTSISRLGRWVLLLQQYSLKVLHVKGIQNKVADMLSRWGYGNEEMTAPEAPQMQIEAVPETNNVRVGEVELFNGRNLKTINELVNEKAAKEPEVALVGTKKEVIDIDWTEFTKNRVSFLFPKATHRFMEVTGSEIEEEQLLAEDERPEGLQKSGRLWRNAEGKLWIPRALVARVVWQNHYRMNHAAITNEVKELELLDLNMRKVNVIAIVKRVHETCLHCTHTPNMIRRQLGKLPHGTRPNEVLLSDYLKIGKDQYLLTIVDDFSRKLQLTYSNSANSETVAMALVKWKGRNGLQKDFILCTDRGSHFTAKLIQKFSKYHPFDHRFSVVYAAFSNGAAESINKPIVKTLQSLCSQFQIDYDEWPLLVDVIVSVLNNRRNRERDDLSPLEIHCNRRIGQGGLFADYSILEETSLLPMIRNGKFREPLDWEETREFMKKLESLIFEQDKYIFDLVELKRTLARERYTKKFNLARIGFGIGDLVLVSNFGTTRAKDKLKLRWNGPYVVLNVVGDRLFQVQDR